MAEDTYDIVKYCALHWWIMGKHRPMPLEPPTDFLKAHASKTFHAFLEDHGLLALVGLLQYGYEVQGYRGMALKNIPAFYGLVWITPIVLKTILLDAMKVENRPVVTAWTKGWGDLWDQIVKKENLNIIY